MLATFSWPIGLVLPPVLPTVSHAVAAPAIAQSRMLRDDAQIFPMVTLAGQLVDVKPNSDSYAAKSSELSLNELVENIPASDLDLQGDAGVTRDAAGLSRAQLRSAKAEKASAAKAVSKAKSETVAAASKAYDAYEDVQELK